MGPLAVSVEAMNEAERLRSASLIGVEPADPDSQDAQYCLERYFAELNQRFADGFDAALSIPADAADFRPPGGVLLVASLRAAPVGCAALRLHGTDPAEIKRMWVDGSMRGLGLGRRLLTEIERYAQDRSVTTLRLETNASLTEAINLYRSCGYAEVPAFNDETYAHHWFEKHLSDPSA
jgi:GNAT superfamily N-acetyltransferase